VSDDDLYFASARDLAAPIRLDEVSRSRMERELMRHWKNNRHKGDSWPQWTCAVSAAA